MSNHTPGPWEAGRPDTSTTSTVTGKWVYAGDKYLGMASSEDTEQWDEVVANARLIAAAPDLLAACEAMLAAFDYAGTRTVGREYEAKNQLLAAIAKAKGE